MKGEDLQSLPLADLIAEFTAIAEEHEELMWRLRVTKAKRLSARVEVVAREIASRGEAGANAMTALFDHHEPAVRGRAAAGCLRYNIARDKAINVLADICDLNGGHVSADAMVALISADEFDVKTGSKRRRT